jgi:hypothetical protein
VSYQQIVGWRACASSRRSLVISIAIVVLISASKLLNFGAVFYSDSLDYINYAEFLRGKSIPWFPHHRTIGYPFFIAVLNSFTQTKLITAVVVTQTLLATFSAVFVAFALRNIAGALQLLGVGVVAAFLGTRYTEYIMTESVLISCSLILFGLCVIVDQGKQSRVVAGALLALMVMLSFFGILVRPTFAVLAWPILGFLAVRRAVPFSFILIAGLSLSAGLAAATILDRVILSPGRLNPTTEVPGVHQSIAALNYAFVVDVERRLEGGLAQLSFAEKAAEARRITSVEKEHGKCTVLPCVAGSRRLWIALRQFWRDPKLLIVGPTPGSVVGAGRFWHATSPIWIYKRYAAPVPNSIGELLLAAPDASLPALRSLTSVIDGGLQRNPGWMESLPRRQEFDAQCKTNSIAACLLLRKDINTRWMIWNIVEMEMGSLGANAMFAAAAKDVEGQLPGARIALVANQFMNGLLGAPWLDFDSGELRYLPAYDSGVADVEWLPAYVDPNVRVNIIESQLKHGQTFAVDLQGLIMEAGRPAAMLLFLVLLPWISGRRREVGAALCLLCMVIFIVSTLALSLATTINPRYLDPALPFLFIGLILGIAPFHKAKPVQGGAW